MTAGPAALAAVAVLAAGSFACGNWDNQPIGHRLFVQVMAVQPAGQGQIRYTFQAPNLTNLSSASAGGGTPGATAFNLSVTAASLGQAIARVQTLEARRVSFGQLQVVILSEHLSPWAVHDLVLGLVDRPKVDGTQYLFASPNPQSLMAPAVVGERLPVDSFSLMATCPDCQAFSHRVQLWEAAASLSAPAGSLVLPELSPGPAGPRWSGFALYRPGEAYALTLSGDDALALGLMRGWTRDLQIRLFVPPFGALEVDRLVGQSRLTPVWRHGALTLVDRLHVEGRVSALAGSQPRSRAAAVAPAVRDAVAAALLTRCLAVYARAQAAGADPFELGNRLAAEHPSDPRLRRWAQELRRAGLRLTLQASLTPRGTVA